KMKFLVNSMLGKLARFLRIFGYDTIYANDLIDLFKMNPVPDEMLIDYARKNDRFIITKDFPLYRSYLNRSIYLKGKGIYNYLSQLNKMFGLKFKFNLQRARCSICNSELERVKNKDLIKDIILEETYNNYNEFYQCSNLQCNKIYWQGSHIEDIEYRLGKTLEFE
ncbi:MAG: Mut7-C RNAse domain-containing protein, partial [Promethearchaeota archaeon]